MCKCTAGDTLTALSAPGASATAAPPRRPCALPLPPYRRRPVPAPPPPQTANKLRSARFDVVYLDEDMRITRGDRVGGRSRQHTAAVSGAGAVQRSF